jgi:uncharacterized protein YqjF (DUF2071 family)
MSDVSQPELDRILATTTHRPYPLPRGPWRLRQRWNDLLFCHWAVPPAEVQRLLPPGLEVDTFGGDAFLGVIPFWMDRVRSRIVGNLAIGVPTTDTFPELNLRTYVRSRVSGLAGVFFFSLDCASPLAVFGARTLFHLPYFPAKMTRAPIADGQTLYRSRRQFTRVPANYEATYGPLPKQPAPLQPQSLAQRAQRETQTYAVEPQESAPLPAPSARGFIPPGLTHFLTERYCLFTPAFGRMLVGHIHHLPWTLEPAQARIRLNQIPAAHGLSVPESAPILHFSRSLQVLLWGLRTDGPGDSSYR